MAITHRDADSPYKLRMSGADKPKKAITTARKYIAYEQKRPTNQQTPYTPDWPPYWSKLRIAKRKLRMPKPAGPSRPRR